MSISSVSKLPYIGPLMIDLAGASLDREEEALLQHELVGGVILFARNYQCSSQLQDLVASIHSVKPDVLIAVDQEGGDVQRFRQGFTKLPEARYFGQLYDRDKEEAKRAIKDFATIMAEELLAHGIDFSFAPVVDLDLGNLAIGSRAFHQNPMVVVELATLFVNTVNELGMAAVGKHFPGHGSVVCDSHHSLPSCDDDLASSLLQQSLYPFKKLAILPIKAMMTAHVVFSAIDNNPASLSSIWLQQILRQKLNYQGAIFSDDLNMKALAYLGNYLLRCQLSLQAGCDMILICNNRKAVLSVIRSLQDDRLCDSQQRLSAMYSRKTADRLGIV